MIGIKSTIPLLICVLFLVPALTIFPNPKYTQLGESVTLGNPKICGNFQLTI